MATFERKYQTIMATRAPVGASNKSELFDLKILVEIFPRPDDALH